MTRINQRNLPRPIIVVGQPRSGSTILTRYLNEFEGTFIINDFYVLQKIDGADLWGKLTPDEAQLIARWIYRILEIRCTQEVGKTLEQPVHLSLKQLAEIKEIVQMPWADGLFWSNVLEKILAKAAELTGAKTWGWNTPQDHLHLERIYKAYPDAKVIAQLRSPEAVLNSYKNVYGWWHDARRYNPIAQALAWKKAARSILRWQKERPDDFLYIRFEGLIEKTNEHGLLIAKHCGLHPVATNLKSLGTNSSYSNIRKKQTVTDTELIIANLIIGNDAQRLKYALRRNLRPSFRGLLEILKIIKNSFSIIISDYLFDSDKRKRVLAIIKN